MFLNDKCIQTFITEHSFLIIVCKDHPHTYVDWSKKESKFDTSTKTNFYKLSLAETKMRMHFIWEHTFILINYIVEKFTLTCFVWAKFFKTHFLFDFWTIFSKYHITEHEWKSFDDFYQQSFSLSLCVWVRKSVCHNFLCPQLESHEYSDSIDNIIGHCISYYVVSKVYTRLYL